MNISKRWRQLALVGGVAFIASASGLGGSAGAQQLVYTPINPQFGGNPLNASQLEADANAQNRFSAAHSQANQTQAQLFASQLQSILLSDLASQVSQAIFGPNAQNSGTFSFGGETVTFVKSLTETTINITDASGGKTTITIPNTTSVGGGG